MTSILAEQDVVLGKILVELRGKLLQAGLVTPDIGSAVFDKRGLLKQSVRRERFWSWGNRGPRAS